MPETARPPRVFVTRLLPGDAVARLGAHADVDQWADELPPSYDELVRRTTNADGIICLLTDRVDAALLAAAPRLRAICNVAVGYDNIDVPAATTLGIPVGILSIARVSPRSRRQQSDCLIVSDGLGIDPGLLR